MKKVLYWTIISAILPSLAFAQGWGSLPQNDDGYAYATMFAGSFSLLLSIVIGIIATIIVFRSGRKMGGGLFGSVLNYIGIGMILVVLGTVSTAADPLFSVFWVNIASTVFFAVGYIFMVIGANKLFKGIMNT